MSATTIKVSKSTLQDLERLKRRLKTRSLEETISRLVRERRKLLLEDLFGADKGKLTPFTERDRTEERFA